MKVNKLVPVAAALVVGSTVFAQYYNGDPDGVNGFAIDYDFYTYDNFHVSATGMLVFGVYANVYANATIRIMNWEFRRGISEGNGGTLVASGTCAVTQTPNGFDHFGFKGYTLDCQDMAVTLGEGDYWLGINVHGQDRCFIATCAPVDGQTFLNSEDFGFNFTDWQNVVGPGIWDVSFGIKGEGVPEPATFLTIGIGLAALAAQRRAGKN